MTYPEGNQVKEMVAGALDTAAANLRKAGESSGNGTFAAQAAQKLGGAAGYLRQKDINDIMRDAERLVKTFPTESLVAAAAVGIIAGAAFRRR